MIDHATTTKVATMGARRAESVGGRAAAAGDGIDLRDDLDTICQQLKELWACHGDTPTQRQYPAHLA